MKMLMRGAHLHIFLCWNVINYYVLWWWMQLSMAGPPCLISYQKILRSKKWIGIPNFTFHFTPLSLCLQISLHHCRWQTFFFFPRRFTANFTLSLRSLLRSVLFSISSVTAVNAVCLWLWEIWISAGGGRVTQGNLGLLGCWSKKFPKFLSTLSDLV